MFIGTIGGSAKNIGRWHVSNRHDMVGRLVSRADPLPPSPSHVYLCMWGLHMEIQHTATVSVTIDINMCNVLLTTTRFCVVLINVSLVKWLWVGWGGEEGQSSRGVGERGGGNEKRLSSQQSSSLACRPRKPLRSGKQQIMFIHRPPNHRDPGLHRDVMPHLRKARARH